MKNIYENLLEIQNVSGQLKGLLLEDDIDMVFKKLAERQTLLDKLQGFLADVDMESRKSSNYETKEIIKSILALDKKNIKEVKARLSDLTNSLSFLEKEKKTRKRLQSATKVRRKKIVDILY